MFGIKRLARPEDFPRLAAGAIRASDRLREQIYGMEPGVQLLRALDSMSQAICGAIDPAELCRHAHSQRDFREAAEEAFVSVATYLGSVNTDTDLCQPLHRMVHSAEHMTGLTEEQERMALLMYREFELDGIHLSAEGRARARELNGAVSELETAFSHLATRHRQSVVAPTSLVLQAGRAMRVPDSPTVSVGTPDMVHMLQSHPSEAVRRGAYEALHAPAPDSLALLDLLRTTRHKYARVLGFDSYAHQVQARLMGDPGMVRDFLAEVRGAATAQAEAELHQLALAKQRLGGDNDGPLALWDVGYLRNAEQPSAPSEAAEYFSVDNCLRGLQLICADVFGVQMAEEEPQGAWHPSVRQVGISHPQLGRLGTIYLDLFRRDNKFGGSGHFAIHCGCSTHDGSGAYQEPRLALLCAFSGNGDGRTLLGHAAVLSLFHEFGHALHSVLSRTEFQHLSGTRAMQDFIETPSQLMEYFACDHRVLERFALHHRTGKPIPAEVVDELRRARSDFAGIELQHQVFYAELDQALYASPPDRPAEQVMRDVHRQCHLLPLPEGLQMLATFDHTIGYGGSYYSYLYSGAFASQLWEKLFADDPWSREGGEKLHRGLLAYGGAADPRRLLTNVLGEEPQVPTAALLKKGAFSG